MLICQFCKQDLPRDTELKYSTRHYAHHECYLDAGKDLSTLSLKELTMFPYWPLRKRNLIATVIDLIEAKSAKKGA